MASSDPQGPRDKLQLDVLRVEDLDAVLEIEGRAFPSPWNRGHFLFEIRQNPCAVNHVVRHREEIVGYACVWHLREELKINNFAVRESVRRSGIGSWLLERVLDEAHEDGCTVAMLEVRPSNLAALRLYQRAGFREVGRRRGYYQSTGEDAILMERDLSGEPGTSALT